MSEEKEKPKASRKVARDAYGGFKVVEPSKEELEFFKKKPDVSGMATDDGYVVLNPYSKVQNKEAVVLNESVRLLIAKNKWKFGFQLTLEQKKAFAGYGSEDNIKHTIIARIVSGDSTAGNMTDEQKKIAMQIRKRLIGQ